MILGNTYQDKRISQQRESMMKDNPNDTLTTIEVKVLCMCYGISNIDENNSIIQLRKCQSKKPTTGKSLKHVAKKLGKDKKTLKATEISALNKLNILTKL